MEIKDDPLSFNLSLIVDENLPKKMKLTYEDVIKKNFQTINIPIFILLFSGYSDLLQEPGDLLFLEPNAPIPSCNWII